MTGPAAPPAGLRMGTPAARWVLLTTVLGSGLVMLDGTVVNVALGRIGTDLGAGFAGLQWTVNAYTLTLASLILLGGSLGDHLGRRRVFVVGVVWFALASLLCGLAPNLELLIAGRALQGVGGALLTPGQPRADLRVVPRAGPGGGDRRVVGARRHRRGGRPVPRRLAGGVDLAGGVPGQPAVAALVVVVALRHVPETRDRDAAPGLDVPGTVLAVVAPRRPDLVADRPRGAGRDPGGAGRAGRRAGGASWCSSVWSAARRTRWCRRSCSPTARSPARTSPRCSSTARWAWCSSCWCCSCRSSPGSAR